MSLLRVSPIRTFGDEFRHGGTGRRGRPEDEAEIGDAGDLAQRLGRLDQLERFGRELKQRLRNLVRLVDQALG